MCDQLTTKPGSSEVRESTLFDQRCSTMQVALQTFCVCFLVLLGGVQSLEDNSTKVVIDAYPSTAMVERGTTLVLVCRVVGVPSTTVLSYQWTCPGGSCDAGAVDPEWAAKVQQDNILVVNVRNGNDAGNYTCTVQDSTPIELGSASYSVAVTYGLSFLNEDGGLRVFFPNNSFVTNTTLTHTNSPRGGQGAPRGNDHIVCYGEGKHTTKVIWHNSSGVLEECAQPCSVCGPKCVRNGGVGVDPPLLRHTHIHMYTNSTAYVNQDLECRTFGGASSSIFIGMYLKDGVNTTLQPPSNITEGAAIATTVSVSWSQVSGATGYYVRYQRQDLGTPPVVTPQYERIVGGANTSVTLSGLEPGTTYRIRVWSTNGASVSSEAREMNVTTVESAPTPPRMLAVTGIPTGGTVELNWLPPLHPNGAIRYEIEYEPEMTIGDPVIAKRSSSLYFTLTLPNDLPSYTVRVRAVNSRGSATSGDLVVKPGSQRPTALTSTALSTESKHTTTTTTPVPTTYTHAPTVVSSATTKTISNTPPVSTSSSKTDNYPVTTIKQTPIADSSPTPVATSREPGSHSITSMTPTERTESTTFISPTPYENPESNSTTPITPPNDGTDYALMVSVVVVVVLLFVMGGIICAVVFGVRSWRSKNKGQPEDSYTAYDFHYVPDQDTVQQPTYDEPPAEPSKETPDTTDGTYACVLSTSEQTEQQPCLHISPPVENGYASPDIRNQPEQPQLHPNTHAPPTCSYSYVLPPDSSQQLEEPQQHAPLDALTTTKNDYSFVLSPEVNQQPEEPQHQTSVGAVLETTGGPHNDPKQPIYQNIAISNKHSPEPPEVAIEHVYATVIMQNKKKLRSAEVPTEKPSEEMLEPTNSPTLPPNPGYSVPRSIPAKVDSLVPTQPLHTQTSPPKSTSQEVPTSIAEYATLDSLELTQPQTSPPNSTFQKVPTSVPEYATVDSLEPTQPAHTQSSALKPTSPEVPTSMPEYATVDSLVPAQSARTQTSPLKSTSQKDKSGRGDKFIFKDSAFDTFLSQVERLHARGKASFEAEFNSIERKTSSSTAAAERNSAKNRYKNILPYDSSRVVLSVPNTSGTDYINASFVDGYKKRDSYIASQAPIPGTVDDFWQMMWDQNTIMVVQLTKNVEGTLRKRKSEDYYPVSPGDTFISGRFQIKIISLKCHVDYEVRVLEVAQISNPSQTHTLDHYLFTGWPDYGVPKYPTSLIRMLYHVREARVSDVPILVHCSAGVGRSGTFIALDITLDQMNAEQTVDIKGTVKKMREKRMYMIQTAEQYMFAYNAVRELLLLGDTAIKEHGLQNALSQLKCNVGGRSGYQQQFDALNMLTQVSADDKQVEYNPLTVRYPDRAPFETKHMFVSRPGSRRSAPINATPVDGYRAPCAFIAAQSPMETTMDDFWTLISEKKVQTVLLLCQLVEDTQDSCYKFWPTEGVPLMVGTMKVILLDRNVTIDIDTYKMNIQKQDSVHNVTLLHYKQWPERSRPKSVSFLKFLASVESLQQPHIGRPMAILVACNDGLGRTGTFIALWSLIEQMKAEGQIDVVSTIKSIRTQRPGAVPRLDQFVYCHDLLLEYVDSFEGYSNFNV